MIFKNIELIESSDIQVLVDNEVPEGKQLDYKKKLPANSDGDKKEFLADIVSFANSSGGDIIYGISETENDTNSDIETAYQVSGLEEINFDHEILRLDNILRDGISPRIVGVQIRGIQTHESDPKVIIIRIPKSWNSPHMVIYKSKSRFHARNNAGKYHMDISEIRDAFLASSTLLEKIREFRNTRISKILSGDIPITLQDTRTNDAAKIVVHLMPLESFNLGTIVALDTLENERNLLAPINWSRCAYRYNFDGYLAFDSGPNGISSYTQFFRNGIIEAVELNILRRMGNIRLIPNPSFERKIIKFIRNYYTLQNKSGLGFPIIVAISLINVRGYVLENPHSTFARGEAIERQSLIIPELILDKENTSISKLLRPALDTVWQACGWERSYGYNDEGQWIGFDKYRASKS